jgi:DNA-binding transcriptional MerR regulator
MSRVWRSAVMMLGGASSEAAISARVRTCQDGRAWRADQTSPWRSLHGGPSAPTARTTTHTLRFYEQEGLFFAPVRRNAAGRRVFTEEEVEWLRVCTKLRSSGMPLPEIRRYAQLVLGGAGNEAERLEILRRHEAPLLALAAVMMTGCASHGVAAPKETSAPASGAAGCDPPSRASCATSGR